MSAHEHLSDNVLIDALYGLADAGTGANAGINAGINMDIDARVRACPVCSARWNELQEQRAAIAVPVEVSSEVLAAQRRNIYRNIEHPSPWQHASRWAGPTLAAAACALAIGIFVHGPQSPEHSAPAEVPAVMSDTQLYSDVYAMEQSFEPSTAASIRVLFEPDDSAKDGASQAADTGTKPGTEQ
jgi:hypothetical protein